MRSATGASMAITITITQDDLLGLSPQFSQSINRVLQWMGEVDSAIGSGGNNLRVVASTAALQAVAAADRAEGNVAVLADSGQIMRFSAASSAPEALGPPITVIAPNTGTGRWLAVALPPQASVDTATIVASAVTPAKLANAVLSTGGAAFTIFATTSSVVAIGATGASIDLSASGFNVTLLDAWYIPEGTVGALSTIQIQTAAGAANLTEALDIAAAAAGSVNRFATIDQLTNTLAANAGFRVETVGTDLTGVLVCLWAKQG
jgi:hypothetical protein